MSGPGVVVVSFIGGDMEAQGGTCQVHGLKAGKGQALDSSLDPGLRRLPLHSTLQVVSCFGQSMNSQ